MKMLTCEYTPYSWWETYPIYIANKTNKLCHRKLRSFATHLTLRLPSTTIVPYANSLDQDETPSNLASHPDPSCFTLRQYFHQL